MSGMEMTNLTKMALAKMFASNLRFDGRKLDEFRDLTIEDDVSNKAEGSARVRLGKTEVVVGIKMAVGTPYADSADKGNISVSADLLPLASPRFENGPPGFDAIELPRLVDRAIREAKIIDLTKLVIKEGEKVWTVFIDVYPINDDGNLIDAATIGALVALKRATVPAIDKDGKVDYEEKTRKKLPLNEDIEPLSFSFFKIGNSIILDPTREEQEAAETRVTFGVSKQGKSYLIHSCQKAGNAILTSQEIESMMKILSDRYDLVMEKLKKFL